MAGRPTKLEKISECKNFLISEGFEIIQPNTMQCTCCGKFKKQNKTKSDSADSFYRSYSKMYKETKILPICKSCIDEMYNQYCIETKDNKKLSMYRMCEELNLWWSESIWEVAIESKSTTHKVYIQKINSLPQYQGLTWKDSDDYIGEITEEVFSDEDVVKLSKKAKEILISEWGEGFTHSQYQYLDNEMVQLTSSFECSDYGMKLIMKDICWLNLEIYQNKKEGKDVSKLIDARSKLMNDGNLKPIQASGANASDQMSYGLFIKKLENDRPVSDPDPMWADVDGIRKYIRIWFLGHLCSMMGIKNEYAEEYEKELALYTVELEINEDDDLDDENESDING